MADRCRRWIVANKEINRRIDLWGDDSTQRRMLQIGVTRFWNENMKRFLRRPYFVEEGFGVGMNFFESFAEISGNFWRNFTLKVRMCSIE